MKPSRAGAGGAQAKRSTAPQTKATKDAARAVPVAKPFKPRRAWFVVLMIVFALWVAALVVMYFATVYPNREKAPPPLAPSPSGRGLG